MKQLGKVRRHKPTGCLVWFPNDCATGIVVEVGESWKLGQAYSHWIESNLEETELEIEFKLVKKEDNEK